MEELGLSLADRMSGHSRASIDEPQMEGYEWPKSGRTETARRLGYGDSLSSARVRSGPPQPPDPHGPRRRLGPEFGPRGSESARSGRAVRSARGKPLPGLRLPGAPGGSLLY